VTIHQIQLRYDPLADRLLLQVRTTQAQLYATWLTRRMVSRLYAPLRQAVVKQGLAQALPRTTAQATPVPEARAMLEDAALQRQLAGANFSQPFEDSGASHPLGREPLLAAGAQLTARPDGGLALALQEDRGRRVEMVLTSDIATALLRLMDAALKAAEWDLPAAGSVAPAADISIPVPPNRLN
jgi:hypothetical protein